MTGFQVGQARTYKKKWPRWVMNDPEVARVIQVAFPKWRTDERQRKGAGRWVYVLHLYYRMNYTMKDIGEELGVPTSTVRGVVQRAKLVSLGRRSNGSGARGGKKGRRRVKQMVCINSGTYERSKHLTSLVAQSSNV